MKTAEILFDIDEMMNDSEISVLEAMIESYTKTVTIMENYSGESLDNFSIFTEAATGDSEKENTGAISKIISFIKKLITSFLNKIKGIFSKSTDKLNKASNKELSKDDINKLSAKAKAAGIAGAFTVTLGAGGLVFAKKSEIKQHINDKEDEKKAGRYADTTSFKKSIIDDFCKDSDRRSSSSWDIIDYINIDRHSDMYYYHTIRAVNFGWLMKQIKGHFDDFHDAVESYINYTKRSGSDGRHGFTKESYERRVVEDFNSLTEKLNVYPMISDWCFPHTKCYGSYKDKHGESFKKELDDMGRFLTDSLIYDRFADDIKKFVETYEAVGKNAYKWNKGQAEKIAKDDTAKFTKQKDVRTGYSQRYLNGKISEFTSTILKLLTAFAEDIESLSEEYIKKADEMDKKIKELNIEHEEREHKRSDELFEKHEREKAEKAAGEDNTKETDDDQDHDDSKEKNDNK